MIFVKFKLDQSLDEGLIAIEWLDINSNQEQTE